MARVRYSLAEATAEATRQATEFVADRADRDQWRHRNTSPDSVEPPRRSSKHPVVWIVTFAPVLPEDTAMDGGELFVLVDLEFNTVKRINYWNRSEDVT